MQDDLHLLDLRERRSELGLRGLPAGGIVTRGKLVISIHDHRSMRVDAAVPASALGALCVGMAVQVMLDSHELHDCGPCAGTITYLEPHAGGSPLQSRPGWYCLVSVAIGLTCEACVGA